jgi:putative GTP pyrophosphokinase
MKAKPLQTIPMPDRARLERLYEAARPAREAVMNALQQRIIKHLQRKGSSFMVRARIKSFESYFDKLLGLFKEWDGKGPAPRPTDILGFRIVHPFLETLRMTERKLRAIFDFEEVDRKGGELSFNAFGYQSVHLLVKIPRDLSKAYPGADTPAFEIQLRTILQDAWAEVEHELIYKKDFSPFDEPIRRKLAALNANLTLSDILFQEIRDYQRHLQAQLQIRRDVFRSKALKSPVKTMRVHGLKKKLKAPFLRPAAPEQADASIDDLLLHGLLSHNARQYREAIVDYSRILELDPPHSVQPVILMHRGMARFALSEYATALEDFSAAIGLNPDNARSYYYRAETLRYLGRYKDAILDFNLALTLDPFKSEFYLGRARAFLDAGQREKAANDCRKTLNLSPDLTDAKELLNTIRVI